MIPLGKNWSSGARFLLPPIPASTTSATTAYIVAAYLSTAALIVYPIASVEVPALGDYLNHLARMHILSSIGDSADLRRYYEVHWAPIPYLGMDAVVPLLARVLPIYDAGRVFIALCLLLPLAGASALHYAVHRRASLLPLAASLFAYNFLLSWGFLNYLFSVGLSLLLLAAWVATGRWPRWRRAFIFAVPALILFFCHAYGFGAYCLAVAGFELSRAWRAGFHPVRTIIADWIAAAAQALPAAVVLLIAFSTTDFGQVSAGPVVTRYGGIAAKLTALESPFIFLGGRTELAVAALITVALLVGLSLGRLQLAPAIWPAAAAVAFAALFVPEWLLGVWGTDFRFPLVVTLIFVSALSFKPSHPHPLLFLSVLVPLVATKTWLVAMPLQALDRQIAEARQVISHLPRGARLLPAYLDTQRGPLRIGPRQMTFQIPMIAVIDRDAFVHYLFTRVTTVRLREGQSEGPPIFLSDLASDASCKRNDLAPVDNPQSSCSLLDKFDFVLLQHFGSDLRTVPPVLTLIASSNTANLYRINQ